MPVVILPEQNLKLSVASGENLLDALKRHGIYPDAPCGGSGKCGKCKVLANGQVRLACKLFVDRDMTVILNTGEIQAFPHNIHSRNQNSAIRQENCHLAFDIGTTSLVCFLLDGTTGETLAEKSVRNPQTAFGGDVVTRIQKALQGELPQLTSCIRTAMTDLILSLCGDAGILPETVHTVSVVGNPAMQQFFLGIEPRNLVSIPFQPVLTTAETLPCREILPVCPHARLLIVPDISGYIGADTVGCLLASGLYRQEALTLLVDIGTNGEMVLGNRNRMVACAAAAGPALEGANIQFGMRAAAGAIDRVWVENGELKYTVIGGGEAKGICGSGLIDAVAAGLELGLINKRGKLLSKEAILPLTETLWLTQADIHQLQLAKGAIRAGITLMAQQLGVEVDAIEKVQLAGAFGSFLNPENTCRIGLLPESLLDRIQPLGNAAGSGAKMLALDETLLPFTQTLIREIEALELASHPSFPKVFAKAMLFREVDPLSPWLNIAKETGFDAAVILDPRNLTPREDVRAMCKQDKCGAYGKNWMCPPAVGSLEECGQKMRQYKYGILLQTLGHMSKTVDSRCYRETERRHMEHFAALAQKIRQVYPDALCLGTGGCRVCRQCAYPEPCRFPGKALSSMEGYGLFVTQVCRDAGVPYHYGEKTVTYTACILFG